MSIDFTSLTFTEVIRLQNQLSEFIAHRYEKLQAVAFSDIVGSTTYFSRFGNENGRRLLQRHTDLVVKSLTGSGGRIVDTAGDGVFLCFPTVTAAIESMSRLHESCVFQNHGISVAHHLCIRVAIHWGTVLTDGVITTGDPVNMCAKVVSVTRPGEIYVTEAAFFQLDAQQRLCCRRIEPMVVAGINEPVKVYSFVWSDTKRFPTAVIIEETGEQISLPPQALLTFGRLREINGIKANDIALVHKDPTLARQVSRWHFELRRMPEGLILRSVSVRPTDVNGIAMGKGEEAIITPGSLVRLSGVLTLRFFSDIHSGFHEDDASTVIS